MFVAFFAEILALNNKLFLITKLIQYLLVTKTVTYCSVILVLTASGILLYTPTTIRHL